MSEKILEIKDERLSFFTPAGEVKALNGVSFSMNQGDVLGIVGESGSGKSVTAYSIMGLTAYPGRLVGGTVWFNGHQIDKMTEKEFRKVRGNEVSIIFQDPMTSLNPVYTIGNQIVEVMLGPRVCIHLKPGLVASASSGSFRAMPSRMISRISGMVYRISVIRIMILSTQQTRLLPKLPQLPTPKLRRKLLPSIICGSSMMLWPLPRRQTTPRP